MPDDATPATLLDDLPTESDALDFKPYVATFADITASPSMHSPQLTG